MTFSSKPPFRKPFPNPRFNNNFEKDEHRINYRIRAPQVRVIGVGGEQLGVLNVNDAIRIAEENELDLVEVAPTAQPPVCKIMDYGKFIYQEQKKKTEAKKKQTEVVIKELRLRYNTAIGDFKRLTDQAREFLSEGNKVKFSMKFRGREMGNIPLGVDKLIEIKNSLADVAIIDEQSTKPAPFIYVIFTPIKK